MFAELLRLPVADQWRRRYRWDRWTILILRDSFEKSQRTQSRTSVRHKDPNIVVGAPWTVFLLPTYILPRFPCFIFRSEWSYNRIKS